MTGRGAALPATTPQGRESPPRRASHAAKRTNRGLRFDGMERMVGKAEDPPSDAAGIPVRRGSSRRQTLHQSTLRQPPNGDRRTIASHLGRRRQVRPDREPGR